MERRFKYVSLSTEPAMARGARTWPAGTRSVPRRAAEPPDGIASVRRRSPGHVSPGRTRGGGSSGPSRSAIAARCISVTASYCLVRCAAVTSLGELQKAHLDRNQGTGGLTDLISLPVKPRPPGSWARPERANTRPLPRLLRSASSSACCAATRRPRRRAATPGDRDHNAQSAGVRDLLRHRPGIGDYAESPRA